MTPIDAARIDVAKLAHDKGYTLKMQNADDAPINSPIDSPLYWIENGYFISRPFCRLLELKRFLRTLPVFLASETSGCTDGCN